MCRGRTPSDTVTTFSKIRLLSYKLLIKRLLSKTTNILLEDLSSLDLNLEENKISNVAINSTGYFNINISMINNFRL